MTNIRQASAHLTSKRADLRRASGYRLVSIAHHCVHRNRGSWHQVETWPNRFRREVLGWPKNVPRPWRQAGYRQATTSPAQAIRSLPDDPVETPPTQYMLLESNKSGATSSTNAAIVHDNRDKRALELSVSRAAIALAPELSTDVELRRVMTWLAFESAARNDKDVVPVIVGMKDDPHIGLTIRVILADLANGVAARDAYTAELGNTTSPEIIAYLHLRIAWTHYHEGDLELAIATARESLLTYETRDANLAIEWFERRK